MRNSKIILCSYLCVGVLAVTGLILKCLGQTTWCACGKWIPWSWDIWSHHNSRHLIDPYSFTHVLHGIILYAMLHWLWKSGSVSRRFVAAVLLEAAWEVLENSPWIINRYRESTISVDYVGDSIANSLFDIVACVIGFVLASQLSALRSILLFVTVELLLIIVVRDCLTLNVIMLVFPIDAIRHWQMSFQ